MTTLPTGTATFPFTDIEDSTKLWQEKPEKKFNAPWTEGRTITMKQGA